MMAAVATPSAMFALRPAAPDDIPAIVAMGVRFLREGPYRHALTENPDQMATIAARLIADDGGLLLVAVKAGAIVGMIGVLCFSHHLSGERIAGELFWWVEPEHRRHGLRLMQEAERWAKANGARRMQMVAPSDSVARVLQRFGYCHLEAAYDKPL